jgi:hypothetical protein
MVQICISPHRMPFLFFSFGPKVWERSIQILSREGNETGTCALAEWLRILSSFWHSLMQRQVMPSEESCYCSLQLMGQKELNESWRESEWVKVFLFPASKVHKWDVELRKRVLKKNTLLWWKLFSTPSSLQQRAVKMSVTLF